MILVKLRIAHIFGKVCSLHTGLGGIIAFSWSRDPEVVGHPIIDIREFAAMPASPIDKFSNPLVFYFWTHRISFRGIHVMSAFGRLLLAELSRVSAG